MVTTLQMSEADDERHVTPPDWDKLLSEQPLSGLPPLDLPFEPLDELPAFIPNNDALLVEPDLAAFDAWIERAQEEMSTLDGLQRLDFRLESRDMAEEEARLSWLPTSELPTQPAFATQPVLFHSVDPAADRPGDPTLAALHDIGLTTDRSLDLQQDGFHEPVHDERFINGIYQYAPSDVERNCRAMLVSFISPSDKDGCTAQAIEYGSAGSLADVGQDHERVQGALESGGIAAGVNAIEAIEMETAITAHLWSSRDID